jgi:hypothetical protein
MEKRKMYVILAYKNFPVAHNVSHIGLGVSALNTAKVLRSSGVVTDVWPILSTSTIVERIKTAPVRPTHIVIGAPWLPTLDLQVLVHSNPDIHFAVCCHSNVGFLQADPLAITNFRQMLSLEQGALNMSAAGNSQRFCDWIVEAYGRPCTWLPNLYFLESASPVYRRPWAGCSLNIGSFGAVRPLKNTLNAVAAALQLHNDMHIPVKFHFSVARVEIGSTVVRAIDAMVKGVPDFHLIKDDWYQWPDFRQIIRRMDILMQVSYSESFNMVTADGAAESIPSVVSDAIDWAPSDWKAEVDDTLSITRVANNLLNNMHSGAAGFKALLASNVTGLRSWLKWLSA